MTNAFTDAFAKAGFDTDAARLAVAANNLLNRAGMSPEKALSAFEYTLSTDKGLLRAIAVQYLRDRAADMSGKSFVGRGQKLRDSKIQVDFASIDQSVGDDEGQAGCASATTSLLSSFPQNAEREGQNRYALAEGSLPSRSAPDLTAERREGIEKRTQDLRSSVHDGRGQKAYVPQDRFASSVVKPAHDPQPWRPKVIARPIGSIEARLAVSQMVSKTVMDTYRVRGDRAIGDLGWNEAKALARTNEREARVLRYITDHVANARPGALIRDVVKPEVVENAIKLAMEAENAVA